MIFSASFSPFSINTKSACACNPCLIKKSRLNRAFSVSKYAYKINGRPDFPDAFTGVGGVEGERFVMAAIVVVRAGTGGCS